MGGISLCTIMLSGSTGMASGGGCGARIVSSIRIRQSIGLNPTMMSSLDLRCTLIILNCGRRLGGEDASPSDVAMHVGVRAVAYMLHNNVRHV